MFLFSSLFFWELQVFLVALKHVPLKYKSSFFMIFFFLFPSTTFVTRINITLYPVSRFRNACDDWQISNVCSSEQWKPINPEAKKRYDREFLLGFQFSSASMHKPEGLPIISDVVLDEVCCCFTRVKKKLLMNLLLTNISGFLQGLQKPKKYRL